MRRKVLVIAAAIAITGCANTQQMRTVAQLTSARATVVQSQLSDFITAQNDLNAEDAQELAVLNALAQREQQHTALVRSGWTYAKKADWLAAHSYATQVSAADILTAVNAQLPAPTKIDDGGAGAKVGDAVKQLNTVATKPTTIDQLREVYDSVAPIYAAIEAAKASAQATTEKATSATTAKTAANAAASP